MYNPINIDMTQISARQASHRTGAKALSDTDSSAFSDKFTSILKQNAAEKIAAEKEDRLSAKEMTIAEKLAAALIASGNLPKELENLSTEELAAKITEVMEQQGISLDDLNSLSAENLANTFTNIVKALPELQEAPVNQIISSDNILSLAQDIAEVETPKAADTPNYAEFADIDISKLSLSELIEMIGKMPDGDAKDKLIKDVIAKLSNASDTIKDAFEDLYDAAGDTADADITVESENVLPSTDAMLDFIKQQLSALQNGEITDSTVDISKLLAEVTGNITDVVTQQQTFSENLQNISLTLAKLLKSEAKTSISGTDVTDSSQNIQDIEIATQLFNSDDMAVLQSEGKNIKSPTTAKSPTSDDNAQFVANNNTQAVQKNSEISAKVSGISISPEAITTLAAFDESSSNGFNSKNGETALWHSDLGVLNGTSASSSSSFGTYLSTTAKTGYASTPTAQTVALQMQYNAENKVNTMRLQLMPEQLGKLDINLQFRNDGTISAKLTVDKEETLALLKKDASYLEKALQQAGFNVSDDALSFNLKQHGNNNFGGFGNDNRSAQDDFKAYMNDDEFAGSDILQAQIAIETAGYISSTGVNIRV